MSAPTVNLTNEQSLAIDLLARNVAASAAFQQQAGVYDVNSLLATYIHYPWYRVANQQVSGPFAVIYEREGQGVTYRRLADGVEIASGVLALQLGLSMSNPDDPEGEEVRFNNWQGNVVNDIRARAKIPGELRCLLQQTTSPSRSHPAHVAALAAQLPFWFVEYTVNWDPFL